MSIPNKSITKRSEGWSDTVDHLGSVSIDSHDLSSLVRRWMFEPTDSVIVQFFRYGFVGGIAFVSDFSTLWLVTSRIGLHYLASAALGFTVGLTVNYWLSVRWVFEKRRFSSATMQFGLFALTGIVGVGINHLVMWLLTDGVGWHYLGSKLAATVVVYLWNFSSRKVLIF